MKKERLLIATVILLGIAFITSMGILFYYITHSDDLTASVQNSVQQELKKYNLSVDKMSLDDSKITLSVARYCSANDGCRGAQGISLQGSQGIQGAPGVNGSAGVDGRNGLDGKDGESITGPQGERGQSGAPTERRCNAEMSRMEWRNQGDESWQVEYYLSPLQSCPA
jgi:hypothetical protein